MTFAPQETAGERNVDPEQPSKVARFFGALDERKTQQLRATQGAIEIVIEKSEAAASAFLAEQTQDTFC